MKKWTKIFTDRDAPKTESDFQDFLYKFSQCKSHAIREFRFVCDFSINVSFEHVKRIAPNEPEFHLYEYFPMFGANVYHEMTPDLAQESLRKVLPEVYDALEDKSSYSSVVDSYRQSEEIPQCSLIRAMAVKTLENPEIASALYPFVFSIINAFKENLPGATRALYEYASSKYSFQHLKLQSKVPVFWPTLVYESYRGIFRLDIQQAQEIVQYAISAHPFHQELQGIPGNIEFIFEKSDQNLEDNFAIATSQITEAQYHQIFNTIDATDRFSSLHCLLKKYLLATFWRNPFCKYSFKFLHSLQSEDIMPLAFKFFTE